MSYFLTNGLIQVGANTIFCDSIAEDRGATVISNAHSGFVTNTGSNAIGFKPTVKFTTKDVATVLGFLGIGANSITSLGTVVIYKQNVSNEGIRASGTHSKTTLTKGLIVIDSLSASKESAAEISGTIYASSSDGASDPASIVEGSVTFPTVTPFSNTLHLGNVFFNGSSLDSVRGWNMSISNSVFNDLSNGNIYPTVANLLSQDYKFSVSTQNAQQLISNIGVKATAGNGTNGLSLTLNSTSAGVVGASAALTFTAKLGLAVIGSRSYTQGSVLTTDFTFDVAFDGTNAPVTFA